MQTILDTYTPIIFHRSESLNAFPYAFLLYHNLCHSNEWIVDLTDDEYILFLCLLETLRTDTDNEKLS